MLFKLLTMPLMAPVYTTSFLLNQIKTMAERELYDVENLREELLLLQLKLEQQEITEEEFQALEADVIARLRIAREMTEGGGI